MCIGLANFRRTSFSPWAPGSAASVGTSGICSLAPVSRRPTGEPAFARRFLKDRLERSAHLVRRRAWREPAHDPDPPIPGLCPPGAVGLKAQVVGERYRDIGRFAGLHRAIEALRRHANDHRLHAVDLDDLPEDLGALAEATPPVAEGDDRDGRRRGPIVVGGQRAPENGGHAERGVIVAGDELRRCVDLRRAVDEDVDLRERGERKDVRQRRMLGTQALENEERERRARESAGRRVGESVVLARTGHPAPRAFRQSARARARRDS